MNTQEYGQPDKFLLWVLAEFVILGFGHIVLLFSDLAAHLDWRKSSFFHGFLYDLNVIHSRPNFDFEMNRQ
jgi:hypothetical protein